MAAGDGDRPSIGWCAGKDCRKNDRDGALREIAAERCRLVELRCLDLCDGAVIVGPIDGGEVVDPPVVFRKVRKRGVVREIVDHLLDGAELSSAATKRRVDGPKRARALRRIEAKR